MLEVSKYRVPEGTTLDLSSHDPNSKSGFNGRKDEGVAALPYLRRRLADLQRRLWAESSQSLLVVLQALDTGGKDGTIRHVFRGVNPQGVRVSSYGKPNERELAHDYLWRIHRDTPGDGFITVFNRSHYEDVLVVRVRELVPSDQWTRRYHHIREFERMLTDEGTTIVKLFLNISRGEQKARLEARLTESHKNWKFNRGDLDDRDLWDSYQAAFTDAIQETSTDYAPWYVVPANRKWYRNLVVASILVRTLEEMNPQFPEPDPDLEGVVVV